MTDKDIEKLITRMSEVFPTLEQYAPLEEKIDDMAEKLNAVHDRVNLLMTKEEAISLFDMATLKAEHDHIKKSCVKSYTLRYEKLFAIFPRIF